MSKPTKPRKPTKPTKTLKASKSSKPNGESKIKKGILFFESTLPNCPGLFEKANQTIENLNQIWIEDSAIIDFEDDSTSNAPKTARDNKREDELFLSKWLAKTIEDHSEQLKTLISNDLEKITTIPLLIQGFMKAVGKDTLKIIELLNKIEAKLKKSPNKIKDHELGLILNKEINKKKKLADFFEEEVKERSSDFSEGLSKYITHYSVVTHLIDCSNDLISHLLPEKCSNTLTPKQPKNSKPQKTLCSDKIYLSKIEKKIKNIKSPIS